MTLSTIPRRLIKLPRVTNLTAVGATTVYQQQKDGLLPPRIKLTSRSSAWVEDEIATVIAARIAGKSDQEIRELVKQLVAVRAQLISPARPELGSPLLGEAELDLGSIATREDPGRKKPANRRSRIRNYNLSVL